MTINAKNRFWLWEYQLSCLLPPLIPNIFLFILFLFPLNFSMVSQIMSWWSYDFLFIILFNNNKSLVCIMKRKTNLQERVIGGWHWKLRLAMMCKFAAIYRLAVIFMARMNLEDQAHPGHIETRCLLTIKNLMRFFLEDCLVNITFLNFSLHNKWDFYLVWRYMSEK